MSRVTSLERFAREPHAKSSAAAQRLLRLPQVLDRTGLSRSMIYLLESQGMFPKRVKVGLRAVAWPEDEVHLWVETRKASRRPALTETEHHARSQALRNWRLHPTTTTDLEIAHRKGLRAGPNEHSSVTQHSGPGRLK